MRARKETRAPTASEHDEGDCSGGAMLKVKTRLPRGESEHPHSLSVLNQEGLTNEDGAEQSRQDQAESCTTNAVTKCPGKLRGDSIDDRSRGRENGTQILVASED